jgi:hypothetical protein
MANMINLPTLKQLPRILLLSLALSPAATLAATDTQTAAPAIPPQITIVRESGKEDGIAQMIVKGKAHKITANAITSDPRSSTTSTSPAASRAST